LSLAEDGIHTSLVECYSGSEYAEYPRAFTWQNRRLEVLEIMARRRNPAGKSFRVRAADGQAFDLFYDELNQAWQVRLV
jgi:hypothetical protein